MRSIRALLLSSKCVRHETGCLFAVRKCQFSQLADSKNNQNDKRYLQRQTSILTVNRGLKNSRLDDSFDINELFADTQPNDRFEKYGEDRYSNSYGGDRYSNSYGGDRHSRTSTFGDEMLSMDFEDGQLPEINKNIYTEHPDVTAREEAEIQSFHQQHNITVGGPVPRPIFDFNEVNLPEDMVRKLSQMDIDKPTPIQSISIPVALSGTNLVGIAQTGSGKTLSFILPAIQHIKAQTVASHANLTVKALVCVPTRELAVQCAQVASSVAGRGTSVGVAYGGANRHQQYNNLARRGCDLLIATPGRLMDFIMANYIKLDQCSFLVLDEADRMLDMGFGPQIEKIVGQIRPDRQMTMWSATWPREIRQLANKHLKSPEGVAHLKIGSSDLTANANVEQKFFVCKATNKVDGFLEIFKEMHDEGKMLKTLVFTNTRATADFITSRLRRVQVHAMSHHGRNNQATRDRTLEMFRRGRTSVVVATDVAARGIDVKDIDVVVNYDCPKNCVDYIHRIGRTARGNNKGISYTFLTEEDGAIAEDLIDALNTIGHSVDPKLEQLRNWHRQSRRNSRPRSRSRY
uniref:RNA helicase n=1 Tax=Phallusia mammillata TaxID=59560 RepID=A0A6F9DB93_9ASCI|nr:DEAD-box ATP-dependent RNA helicase 20-like [Phallusia mammillata]